MKTNVYYFLFALFFFAVKSDGQIEIELNLNGNGSGNDLIGYTNGKVDTFNFVEHRTPFFKKGYLMADSIKVKLSEVRFYENQEGYFRKFGLGMGNTFYEREIHGNRISTYFAMVQSYNAGAYDPNFPGGTGGYFSTKKKELFSVDNKSIMNLTPKNLKRATADCEECAAILKKTTRKDNIRYGIIGLGAGLMLYGLSDTYKKNDVPANTSPGQENISFSPWIFVGAAGVVFPMWLNQYRNPDMKEVIAIFNEN